MNAQNVTHVHPYHYTRLGFRFENINSPSISYLSTINVCLTIWMCLIITVCSNVVKYEDFILDFIPKLNSCRFMNTSAFFQ